LSHDFFSCGTTWPSPHSIVCPLSARYRLQPGRRVVASETLYFSFLFFPPSNLSSPQFFLSPPSLHGAVCRNKQSSFCRILLPGANRSPPSPPLFRTDSPQFNNLWWRKLLITLNQSIFTGRPTAPPLFFFFFFFRSFSKTVPFATFLPPLCFLHQRRPWLYAGWEATSIEFLFFPRSTDLWLFPRPNEPSRVFGLSGVPRMPVFL